MVDFHWGFDSLAEARELAEAFEDVAQQSELVLLRIMSRIDEVESISLKDERKTKH